MRNFQSDVSVSLNSPILFVYTDGGPDYRTIYWSVKLAHIATFIARDLVMLIAARTAPYQSIFNPAERCMSLLYLALQNISLKRNRMGTNIELRVKPGTTLKKLEIFL